MKHTLITLTLFLTATAALFAQEPPSSETSRAPKQPLQMLDDPPKEIVVFKSCSKGEVSHEDDELKHSIFMHYIVEGLGGKAVDSNSQTVTLLSLFSYVSEQTQRHVLNKYRMIQRPYLRGDITDYVSILQVPNDNSPGRKYAVLIGVDDYAQIRPLRYAKYDIEALRDRLFGIGFDKENVFTLTCGGATRDLPTKENIEVTLQMVFDLANEGDVVIIALSGYAFEVGNQPYFCLLDTKANDLIGSTIDINEVLDKFGKCKASFKLVLIDASHENPFRSK